ncbi:hypothetical protein H6G36_14360 [Anabaena minutissima FACHB-250]|nr:hypothetical protein [Anabaena minutissima FACHB-250]
MTGDRKIVGGLSTHYSLLITHYSLLTTHYSLLITQHSLLSTQHSLLSTQHSALSTQHSALSTQGQNQDCNVSLHSCSYFFFLYKRKDLELIFSQRYVYSAFDTELHSSPVKFFRHCKKFLIICNK